MLVGYWIVLLNGKSLFQYDEQLFTTMIEMIQHICKVKNIRNIEEACAFNIGFKKSKEVTKNNVQTCESFSYFLNKNTKIKSYNVNNKDVYSPTRYTCQGKTFTNFDMALDYSLKTNCVIKYTPHVIRPDHKRTTLKPSVLLKTNCVTLLTGKKCLTRDTGGYKVWLNVWNGCDEKCFEHKNYQSTKYKYTKEINGYRNLRGLKPMETSKVIAYLAQYHADFLSQTNILSNDRNKLTKELVGYTSNCMGKYFVKILFDSFNNYKKLPKKSRVNNDGFGGLMSSKYSYIGIGVSKSHGKVFVVLMFK